MLSLLLYLLRKWRLTFGYSHQWSSVSVVWLCGDWQDVLVRVLEEGNQEIVTLVWYWELSYPKEHSTLSFFPNKFLWNTFLFLLILPFVSCLFDRCLHLNDSPAFRPRTVMMKRWILTLSTWKSSSCHSNPHIYFSHVQSLPLSSTPLSFW